MSKLLIQENILWQIIASDIFASIQVLWHAGEKVESKKTYSSYGASI